MTPSKACSDLVRQFEGCARKRPDSRYDAYPDPASGGDPWTIGWGSTGPDIKPGTVWTQQQADDRLARDLAKFSAQVTAAIGTASTTQPQYDALTCFAYNVGIGNLKGSTLLRLHKAGDQVGARAQFARWNRADGKVLKGLTRRRAAEAALYGSRSA